MSELSEIPLSVLDLSPIVEGGTPGDSFRNSLSLAQHVERLGYTRFWLAEHHNMPGIASAATSVVIGHVAAGTSHDQGRRGRNNAAKSRSACHRRTVRHARVALSRPDRSRARACSGSDRMTAHAFRRRLENDGDDFPELIAGTAILFENAVARPKGPGGAGGGIDIPIWLLGSSGFSAQLAGQLGLPFAFAAHFSPENTLPALELYRRNFRPSEDLRKPYAMVALNVFAADTTKEAQRLATSQHQSFLALIRGAPGKIKPPVDDMDTYLDAAGKGNGRRTAWRIGDRRPRGGESGPR